MRLRTSPIQRRIFIASVLIVVVVVAFAGCAPLSADLNKIVRAENENDKSKYIYDNRIGGA